LSVGDFAIVLLVPCLATTELRFRAVLADVAWRLIEVSELDLELDLGLDLELDL
jgi:hypothetical protein